MGSLYLLLPTGHATAQTEFEYLLSVDGRSISAHATAVAALLPQPTGAGSEIAAIAPASALSWHRVELPQGTGPRSPKLRAVLEGLLEERLLDDPQSLHFALAPQPAAGEPAWVAVCDRAWLRDALQVLEASGHPASRIVPEFAPEGAATLHAVGDPDHPWLVCSGREGVLHLPLASTSLALLPTLPDSTPLVSEPAVAGLAEQLLQHTPELQPAAQRLLQATRTGWDLAQFDFASSGRARALKRLSTGWGDLLRAPEWRPARWAAVLLVAVQLLGLNAWAWRERSSLATKREAGSAILTQAFPNVKVVVDAPVQMEREVAALRQRTGATSSRDLEAALGALATAAPPGRAISTLEYNGTELRVRGLVASDAEAQPIIQALRGRGYAATLQEGAMVVRPEGQP